MPFMDPAFTMAISPYDLSGGPVKLKVPVNRPTPRYRFSPAVGSLYAINDRSAGKKVIELDLMTEAQHGKLPEDEEVTAADQRDHRSHGCRPDPLEGASTGPGLMPQGTGPRSPPQAARCEPNRPVPAKEKLQPRRRNRLRRGASVTTASP